MTKTERTKMAKKMLLFYCEGLLMSLQERDIPPEEQEALYFELERQYSRIEKMFFGSDKEWRSFKLDDGYTYIL